MYVTCVGSRDVTAEEYALMVGIGERLAELGWVIRSGGADGADSAFEEGWDNKGSSLKEIYIPWQGFNGRRAGSGVIIANHLGSFTAAKQMASEIHPAWDKCSIGAQGLHARNCYQVLGRNLDKPSTMLIACAPEVGDSVKGGTRTAWEVARKHKVKCFNLRNTADLERILRWYK